MVKFEREEQFVETSLPFSFNIENSLAMLAVLKQVHGNLLTAVELLKQVSPPPGRCEVTVLSNGATAIVDYAHNCNSLKNILNNTRQHCTGKIITVIGVTGDRLADAEAIGKLCVELSDQAYFTSDNPLGVAPETLFAAMAGKVDSGVYEVEPDREQAIRKAVKQSNSGDVLLICGKGHEQYQYMTHDKACPEPYMGDQEAIRKALNPEL